MERRPSNDIFMVHGGLTGIERTATPWQCFKYNGLIQITGKCNFFLVVSASVACI